jgi:hypothetical protein
MKSIIDYIYEAIKQLPKNVKGIIVFDIDDTLLKVNPDVIKIYKKDENGNEFSLTTEEFAKDPDASDPNKIDLFDLRDFRDPVKVYNSIISGTPLIKNLKIMDSYIEAGYDFCFLTARGCEETVKKALNDFLRVKDNATGEFKKLGDIFKTTLSHAVNDEYKDYPGKDSAEKKANVLKMLCKKYDKVIFVDDDTKNVRAAKDLDIKNLTVIKAWE